MALYAIGDLHLSLAVDKSMEIFGPAWENYISRIEEGLSLLRPEDTLVLAGDTSWGMTLEEAEADFKFLDRFPGKKYLIKGNHDYWWNGITKLRDGAPDGTFYFLQNDCVKIENIIICGSRGWTCPGSSDYGEHDEKLYLREAERFKLCFKEVEKVREEGDVLIVMTHYPPMGLKLQDTLFTKLFEENGADKVVFGHIHGQSFFPFRTVKGGIEYVLTSCDKVGFALQLIL